MKRNEGTVDRIIRLVIGVVLIWVGLWPLNGLQVAVGGIVVAVIGLILLITGLTGYCALYSLLGISTKQE
ncbi:MAG TPA: DUF2892 domain-containing protein [Chloroflexi bacterium]|nr:DUF2892 domain-containing protein [Chloroflexota bacterium]